MPTSRRTLLKNSAAAATVLSLDWTRARAQAETLRIGLIYDLTGPFAAGGSVASSIGAQIAIDLVNEKGGIGGKYKVFPLAADSQSKPDVAINEAERLINQEKIDIINGVYASSHAVPLAGKVEQHKKILWITTAVATAVFKDKNLQYVFRAQIHSDQYGQAFASFIADSRRRPLRGRRCRRRRGLFQAGRPPGRAQGRLLGVRARPLGAGNQAQALRRSCDLACGLQSRHHPFPAPGTRERPTLQDAVWRRRGLQPARQAARGFRRGHRQFLQYRSGARAIARRFQTRARHRRSHQHYGRALPGKNRRDRRSAALFDGLQPDLGPAQQRPARRQGEIRRRSTWISRRAVRSRAMA